MTKPVYVNIYTMAGKPTGECSVHKTREAADNDAAKAESACYGRFGNKAHYIESE